MAQLRCKQGSGNQLALHAIQMQACRKAGVSSAAASSCSAHLVHRRQPVPAWFDGTEDTGSARLLPPALPHPPLLPVLGPARLLPRGPVDLWAPSGCPRAGVGPRNRYLRSGNGHRHRELRAPTHGRQRNEDRDRERTDRVPRRAAHPRGHGPDSQGKTLADGRVIPNLRQGEFKYKTDDQIYNHISEGGNGMVPFRDMLTRREIDLLVNFVQNDLRVLKPSS